MLAAWLADYGQQSAHAVLPDEPSRLTLKDTGTGLERTVEIESAGLFRIGFSAFDNWGLDQWYDLVNDPGASTNILHVTSRAQVTADVDEDAMFQQVFHGTVPDNARLYTRAAGSYFPNEPRSFTIIKASPDLVVVQVKSSPTVNAVGVLSTLIGEVIYVVRPDGAIYIKSTLTAKEPVHVDDWHHAMIGLGDPTSGRPAICGDTMGWIRATASQSPYTWSEGTEPYIYAYWSRSSPMPHASWTKASIFLMPDPNNPLQGKPGCHSWAGFKRWGYGGTALKLAAGQSVTQHYFIQLGTEGSAALPDIKSAAVADALKPDWSLARDVAAAPLISAPSTAAPAPPVSSAPPASSPAASASPAPSPPQTSSPSQPIAVDAVEIGGSGTAPSGNRTPDFHGRAMLTAGYFKELARDVTGDAVDPDSARLIGALLPMNIHVDFSSSTATGGYSLYGIPINVVPGTQPMVPVILEAYASESEPGPVPIPNNPSVEGWYSPTGKLIDKQGVSDGGDHHMLIAVRNEETGDIDTIYELYQVWHDGTTWHAASNARFDLKAGKPRRLGWTSGDAAGLPMLPLLPRYDEIQNGGIKHAMRITFNVGQILNRFVWPARHAAPAGSHTYGIPFGARFRLKKDWYEKNIARFTDEAKAFVEAMRTYGVINADVGGSAFLSGVSDGRYSLANLLTLQTIPMSAFEMLKLVPLWDITGPDCVRVGVPEDITIAHFPPNDSNMGERGLYINVDGRFDEAFFDRARVIWTEDPGSLRQTIRFTAPKPGTYAISGDPAGAYYYAPPQPLTLTSCD